MSITKPYTFTAGTKARANEVNDDFDTLYSQVNANISEIAQNASDIENLEATKADLNGNASQRFSVANAVNSGDAVNKQTLESLTYNARGYIDGLVISKSNDNTILVTAGSAYDSTYSTVLKLSGTTSKTNYSQGANTTYYVHIIGNDSGTSTDILISSSSISPALPSGYTKYRLLGNFTTDSSGNINYVNNRSGATTPSEYIYVPNYSGGWGIGLPYTVSQSGWFLSYLENLNINGSALVYVNGKTVNSCIGGSSGGIPDRGSSMVRVSSGDYITINSSVSTVICWFIPQKQLRVS